MSWMMQRPRSHRSVLGAGTGNERAGLRDNEGKGTMPCIGRCLEVSDVQTLMGHGVEERNVPVASQTTPRAAL